MILKLNKLFSRFILLLAKYCYQNNYYNLEYYYSIALSNHLKIKYVNQPQSLKNILVLAEDRKYYSHIGIDLFAIVRAVYFNFIGQRQGASTISQQYIRVLTNNYELSIKRKITEIFLSLLLNDIFLKEEIINNYLSIAYFGYDMEGIDTTMNKLEVSRNNLTVNQAASLIALLKYPQTKGYKEKNQRLIKIRTQHLIYISKTNKWYNKQINSRTSISDQLD